MLPNEATTRSEIVAVPGELEALVAAPGRHDGRPIVAFLKQEKLNVNLVGDADSAFEEALLHRPDIVLIHDDLPPAGGIELCQRLKANTRTHFLPAVIIGREESRPHRIRALAAGADAVFVPGMDEQEQRTRMWALLRSHTLYRRQENRRNVQRTVLKEQSRWLGTFVHDLQNAIGALQANFEFLGQNAVGQPGGKADDVRDCLRDTRGVLQQLTRGLRTVQDFERFQTGQVVLRRVPLDLSAVLAEAREDLLAGLNGSARPVHLPPEDGRVGRWLVLADRDLLRRAIVSLATYLLRQPRTTCLQFSLQEITGGGIRLTILGDGEAIAPDDRQRVFEPYLRIPRRATLAHGLGLALARAILELHAGSVTVGEHPPDRPSFVVELKSRDPSPNHPMGQ